MSTLDQEVMTQYILTVTTLYVGSPHLITTQMFIKYISDVSDSALVFNQSSYTM